MTDMAFRNMVLRVVWTALIAFVVLLSLAMLFYPDKDGHMGGYRFFRDVISVLGMTRTREGVANLTSCLMFNIGLGTAMLALIPFWYIRVKCIRGGYWLKVAGFLLCTGFSLGIVGVALTPYNLLARIHDPSVHSALAMIIPGCLILIMWAEEDYCKLSYKLGWLGFAIVLFSCEAVVVLMIQKNILQQSPSIPIIQKVDVTIFIVWLGMELLLYQKYLRARPSAEPIIADE